MRNPSFVTEVDGRACEGPPRHDAVTPAVGDAASLVLAVVSLFAKYACRDWFCPTVSSPGSAWSASRDTALGTSRCRTLPTPHGEPN